MSTSVQVVGAFAAVLDSVSWYGLIEAVFLQTVFLVRCCGVLLLRMADVAADVKALAAVEVMLHAGCMTGGLLGPGKLCCHCQHKRTVSCRAV